MILLSSCVFESHYWMSHSTVPPPHIRWCNRLCRKTANPMRQPCHHRQRLAKFLSRMLCTGIVSLHWTSHQFLLNFREPCKLIRVRSGRSQRTESKTRGRQTAQHAKLRR